MILNWRNFVKNPWQNVSFLKSDIAFVHIANGELTYSELVIDEVES